MVLFTGLKALIFGQAHHLLLYTQICLLQNSVFQNQKQTRDKPTDLFSHKYKYLINTFRMSFKRVLPLLNRIVVRKIEPQSKTNSGIIINKPDTNPYGVVLECGPGQHDQNGKIIPLGVKVGDTVMLPDFGGQKVKLGEQQLFIFRDTDIIAKME